MLGKFKDAALNVMSKYTQNNDGIQVERIKKPEKYTYARPFFLGLDKDEVKCAQDFGLRPVVKPRKLEELILSAGYAECINGGKSDVNEDNCYACVLQVKPRPAINDDKKPAGKSQPGNPTCDGENQMPGTSIPETSMVEIASHRLIHSLYAAYYGLFDGHAGYQTSLIVSRLLHRHVQDKLQLCLDLIAEKSSDRPPCPFDPFSGISIDDLIIGALEEAFQEMEEYFENLPNIGLAHGQVRGASYTTVIDGGLCRQDDQLLCEGQQYHVKGGCTTLVVLILEGKMYIANAGDSRAVLCHGDKVEQVTRDFNPIADKQRVNYILQMNLITGVCHLELGGILEYTLQFDAKGHIHPELLHNEFTCLEFPRRLNKNDIGQVLLCRKPGRDGWSYKTIDEDDLKFPLVTGGGKKARIMATIGVTRGLGDHDLYVYDSKIWIKPFLSCKPEVRVIDLTEHQWTDDDVLILGTDGLWDVISNEEAADIIKTEFFSCNKNDSKKYTIAAQVLVSEARGNFTGQGWKKKNGDMASFDDITALVIPIKTYLEQWRNGQLNDSGIT